MCAQIFPRKWSPTPSYCLKNSLRGLDGKAFSLAKGGGGKKCTPFYAVCATPTAVPTYFTCTLWGLTVHAHHHQTCDSLVIHRRAAGRLADQMSSPGDYLPVRVGPAFGIAPCGELLSKEFRVEWREKPRYKVCACSKCVQNGLLHPYTAQKLRCAA